MKLLSEILVAAKDLISKPENWTQGTYARDKFNYPVAFNSYDACQFCILGSILQVQQPKTTIRPFIELAEAKLGEANIPKFNDNHTHPEALGFMDKLIEAAKQEELNAQN